MEQKLRRNTTLGDNLRRLRKAAGLTQAMAVAQLQLLGFDISRESLLFSSPLNPLEKVVVAV